MPKGGYCEACGRWVWIEPDGSCQNGHPAGQVREVRELVALSPRGHRIWMPVRPVHVPYKARDWFRYSGWLVFTLTWGFLNWLAFIYVGVRARRVLWVLWGLVYAVPLALFIASLGTGYVWYALGLQVFVAAVSVVHGFIIRPRYRSIMFGDPPSGSAPGLPRLAPAPVLLIPDGKLTEGVAGALREARDKVGRLQHLGGGIVDPEVREAIRRLCISGNEIIAELTSHPERMQSAREFFTYYLDASLTIAGGYQELAGRENRTPDMVATMEQAKAALSGVQRALDAQRAVLVERDLLDLDSEIALLEKVIKMNDRFDAGRASLPSGPDENREK